MTIPVPYPADTRAKGWRFELDHERIRQSDTWAIAPADVRPWLLMLWMVAWEQTPCASLPDDDALIAARIGIQAKTFAKHRAVILRGWWKAEDGRLYHDVMVERVAAMLAKRERDQKRAANYRARSSLPEADDALLTGASHVTSADPHVSSTPSTKHQSSSPSVKKAASKPAAPPCPEDVAPQVWADWLALRKAKRTTASATAIESARAEAAKAGMTFEAFLRVWCARGSQGLQAEWLKPNERQQFGAATSWPATPPSKAAEETAAMLARQAEHASRSTPPPAALLAIVGKAVKPVEAA